MSTAPRLLTATTRAPIAPYKTQGLYHEIHLWQDDALIGVGAHSSAVTAIQNVRIADGNHDACLTYARECLARGEYARADHWIAQAEHWDSVEDRFVTRIWRAFSETADACRRIVAAVEKLFGRTHENRPRRGTRAAAEQAPLGLEES